VSYMLKPLKGEVVLVEMTPEEIRTLTERTLISPETYSMDVLQFGHVYAVAEDVSKVQTGDVVLYEKLASHQTNVGDPRQLLVDAKHIHATLDKEDGDAN
jgi:co-chaperonin GroES (HSP10)